jgi:hypothetical protein
LKFSLKTVADRKPRSSSANKIGSFFSRAKSSRKSMGKGKKGEATPITNESSSTQPIRKSSFELVGVKKLRIGDVQNVKTFKLHSTSNTQFTDNITCKVIPTYVSSIEYSSFLTVKTKGSTTSCSAYGNWIRYWARVKGDKMLFWKYPEDVDTKDHEGQIRY